MSDIAAVQHDVANLIIEDENVVTQDIYEKLAYRLAGEWEPFGQQVGIEDHVISQINLDQPTAYDRSMEMLKNWQAVSPFDITVGIVKLTLKGLGRNDILLGIFDHEIEPDLQHLSIEHGNNQTIEFTIARLREGHKKKLGLYLDPDQGTGIKNWLQLGYELTKHKKNLHETIEGLRLHYAGGGNPAMRLFTLLSQKHPTLTVKKFKGIAKELERNDVAHYIESNLSVNGFKNEFRKIGVQHQEKLAGMLNKNIRGISDWRMFADEFNYTSQEIEHMALAIKDPNSFSPTKRLLDLLYTTYPSLPVNEIIAACKKIGRKDVSSYLEGVIKDNGNK